MSDSSLVYGPSGAGGHLPPSNRRARWFKVSPIDSDGMIALGFTLDYSGEVVRVAIPAQDAKIIADEINERLAKSRRQAAVQSVAQPSISSGSPSFDVSAPPRMDQV